MKAVNNPNRWRSLALAMVAVGVAGVASAQVSYFQNWNANTQMQGWVDMGGINSSAFAVFTGNTSCDGTSQGRSPRTLMQNPGAHRAVRSPQVGTSTGGVTTLTFDYKVALNSANNVGAQATSFTFEAFWGASTSGPWQSLGMIDASNHVVSGTCAPAPGTYTFTPPAGSPVYIRFHAVRYAQAILVSFDNVSVQETPPVVCSATPAPGATVSSSNVACEGSTVDLNVENPTTDVGIFYQWYSSTDGGTTWLPGPTTTTWNGAVIDEETAFYVEATCAGHGTGTSTPVTVTLGNFAMCGDYCVNNVGNNLADRGQVMSVALTGESVDIIYVFEDCPIGTTWLVDLLEHEADLLPGATYTVAIDFGTCGTAQSTTGEAWIDFDQSASFDDIERLGSVTGTPPALADTEFTFTVPVDATPGPTRMRVMQRDLGFGPLDPCAGGVGQFSWGSVMDFTINILELDACTATPAPGATISSHAVGCIGEPITLSLETPSLAGGITYQWYASTDGGTTWVPGPTTATWHDAVFNGETIYYCEETCGGAGTGTSTPVTVGLSTQCYCTIAPFASVRPIGRVEFAGILNNSCLDVDCDAYYVDYTAGTPGIVEPGQSYTLNVAGNSSGGSASYYTAFFDWDHDGVFEFLQNIGSYSGYGGTGVTTTIAVPSNAVPGTTRMRIVKKQSSYATNPCTSYNQGQVEDYTIVVQSACATDLFFAYDETTNFGDLTWSIREQGTDMLVQSGGITPGTGSVITCLPDGCFYLVVENNGTEVITGGYRLLAEGGVRLIDNTGNLVLGPGAGSGIADNEGFCLPVGDDRPIHTSCDRFWWQSGNYLVAAENAAVSAEFGVSNATSGYEFWFYDPNGGLSFRKFRNHATSDGFSPNNAVRAAHIKLNNWAAANHLQDNVLYNVRIRGVIDGAELPF
ncbi:MAG: GEVED domain-containing protein, partial [Flavobacteriales bacterium]|nr:GEVED domain-containing protein [Flavobacteriales bacterium]